MKELENISAESELVAPDYPSEIVAVVRGGFTPKILREKIFDYHENDVAESLEIMSPEERKKLFSALRTDSLARVLEYTDTLGVYLDELTERRRRSVLSELEPSVVVDYLESLDEEARLAVVALMDSELKSDVDLLSSFDEEEVGRCMTTNFVSIAEGSSVKEAMNALVSQAADNDNISTLYVTDADGIFAGAIDLKNLIVARKEQSLDSITVTSYPYVYATEHIEDCIERVKNYSEDSIPVLDGDNRLIGVLISQELLQLLDDEISDDYAKLAGLSEEEDLNEPLKKSIAKRLPWLIVLLGLGLVVSSVVGLFEQGVSHLTLIVCFQSLILGMSGNVGTQSLAVTIRVLMDEELSVKSKLFLIVKEARVGLVNGLILGALSFVLIGFYIVLFKSAPFDYAFSVSLCTGLALALAIVISSVVGTFVPILFKGLKIDPAVASGPLITTINDLVAVAAYYGLAWLLLINVMGL